MCVTISPGTEKPHLYARRTKKARSCSWWSQCDVVTFLRVHIIGQGGGVVCYGPWLVTSRARAHLPTYSGPLTAQNTHKVYGEAPRTGSIVLVHDFPSRMSSSLGIERFIHGPESTFDNELERLAPNRLSTN
ncbi:hypothetical protein AG1IA_10193 [Rhizoctonia solani AG-1 IA]|uniref:Uncharacterized protein n=1 Tax=Thanatephorus cucumeris (strain AG1-IA) TaxID=983506 RepID=L8WGF5_THACA|nr:hypothetical protein AG1IA_10193 [Rhizoctonia solani AG-1 IA]